MSSATDAIITLVKNIGTSTTEQLVCKINNMQIAPAELVMVSKLFIRASTVAKKIRPDYRSVQGKTEKLDLTISILINLVNSKMTDQQLVSSAVKIPMAPKDIWEAEKILAFASDIADLSLAAKANAAVTPTGKHESKQLESKVLDTSVPKLNFHNATDLTLPNKRYPFIDEIRAAQDGHAGYIPIERVLSELNAGRKTSCWSWYIFPSLKELRSTTSRPAFLIDGFDGACQLLFAGWFRANLLDVLVSINRQVDAGVKLDTLLGKHDAEKFRQMVYLLVLASQYIERTTYQASTCIQEILPMLTHVSNNINYHFHQETFDIAQCFIDSRVSAAEPGTITSRVSTAEPSVITSRVSTAEPSVITEPGATDWSCTTCTFVNNISLTYCEICGTSR